ncbi:MAG: gamma-glutamyl-gamma-aminobutyrate hydrolase family protein [Pseudomonadota bacterium]
MKTQTAGELLHFPGCLRLIVKHLQWQAKCSFEEATVNPPLIGITTERADPDPLFGMQGYTVESELYRAIAAAGAIPVALPAASDQPLEFLSSLSGLVFSGGGYAMPPHWYRPDGSVSPYEVSPRFDYSVGLLQAALEQSMPILGICAGMQLIAGAYGARLIADLSHHDSNGERHWQVEEHTNVVHEVDIKQDSLLARLVGPARLGVNSIHREAVIECPEHLLVSAVSEEGVIEACEVPGHVFCLGLQWHPEHMREQRIRHVGVFTGLVAAAEQYSSSSNQGRTSRDTGAKDGLSRTAASSFSHSEYSRG